MVCGGCVRGRGPRLSPSPAGARGRQPRGIGRRQLSPIRQHDVGRDARAGRVHEHRHVRAGPSSHQRPLPCARGARLCAFRNQPLLLRRHRHVNLACPVRVFCFVVFSRPHKDTCPHARTPTPTRARPHARAPARTWTKTPWYRLCAWHANCRLDARRGARPDTEQPG